MNERRIYDKPSPHFSLYETISQRRRNKFFEKKGRFIIEGRKAWSKKIIERIWGN